MNRILEATMKRAVLIITSLVLILAWGGISAYHMQRDYLPTINNPTLMISVRAQDYQADQVQASIAGPIKQAVRMVNGLQNVEANSFDGGLLISLYFPMNYDMDRAESDVSHALDNAAMPSGVTKPAVTRVSTSSFPIMRLSLASHSDKIDENTLRTTVQDSVVNQIKSVPGISDVRVTGAGSNGFVVTIHMDELKKAGLTIDDVKQSLATVNPTGAQGTIANSQVSIPIQVAGWSVSEKQLQQTPLHSADGKVTRLAAVATISKSIVDLQTISRTAGKPSVMIDVLKAPSSNITEVSDRIQSRIKEIPGIQAGDISLSVQFDQGLQVKSSLTGLVKEGLLGCLFSMLCVFFFFRNVRSTVLIAISLPICLLTTTGLLNLMGVSLNILTVSGLIVAMGRVVDDSIVILDNMHRKVKESDGRVSPAHLADAVREMVPAIVSSTATTVAVYVPIALIGGMISAAFAGFAWSVVIALVTSLFVSLLVVPALYHLWRKEQAKDSAVAVEPFAQKLLSWFFARKGKVFLVFCLLFAVAVTGAAFLPVNFLPTNKPGQIAIHVELPDGTSLSEVDTEVKQIEQSLKTDPRVTTYSSNLGSSFAPQFDDVFDAGGGWIQGSNIADIAVSLKGNVDMDSFAAELQSKLSTLSRTAICTVTKMNISGDDSQMKINLTGADSNTLETAARLIRGKLQLVPGVSVEGAADDKDSLAKYQISLNQDLIERSGVNVQDVLSRIRAYLAQGTKVNVMTSDQQSTPIVINTDLVNKLTNVNNSNAAAANDPETQVFRLMGSEMFKGKDGKDIRLDQIASLLPSNGQTVIRERDGSPFSLVTANITSTDVEQTTEQVQDVLNHLALPPGVKYTIGGTSAQVREMISGMAMALSVSVLLVLLIVSTMFRGWRAPLSVLICIPFAFIGSVMGMFSFGKEWNIAALVGLLMLTGIVVTNGIVLVDKIERNLAGGMNPKEAILQGTVSRVRPVLMTAATTILTLLPLAFSNSGDTLISQTLGVVVVCGMISSTLISLLVIPMMYEFMYRTSSVASARKGFIAKTVSLFSK